MKTGFMRSSAALLLYLATKTLPPSRREWARDMRAELDYVESDTTALQWAFGCVLASAYERVVGMIDAKAVISRPILVLEWLVCFVPLTLLWCATVAIIVSYESVPAAVIIGAATGVLGPVALTVSMAATLSGWSNEVRRVTRWLTAAFGVMFVLQLVNAGVPGRFPLLWFEFDVSVFVLCSLLPLLGCLHLAQWVTHSQCDRKSMFTFLMR